MPRALISVFDKTGIEKLCTFLHSKGYELVSTGGTHDKLVAAGIPVTKIDAVTGFPEILGGRVKTLHPKVCSSSCFHPHGRFMVDCWPKGKKKAKWRN
jgi:AICAR transformylase/IMP cyclohydrolase PurH